ncbi:MAG: hypothetical protein WDN10_02510 [bacterium]
MAKAMGMSYIDLNRRLFPVNAPARLVPTIEELEEELEESETMGEVAYVINETKPGSPLRHRATQKHYALWIKARDEARTIAEWYEVHRFARFDKQRDAARAKIDNIFESKFNAADTLPKLMELWEALPRKSRTFGYLRTRMLFKIAEYYQDEGG